MQIIEAPHQLDRSYLELKGAQAHWPRAENDLSRILFLALNVPGYYSLPVRLLSLMVCEDETLNQSYDARFFEADANTPTAELLESIDRWQPELLALSVNIWNCEALDTLTRGLKQRHNAPLVIGGGQETTNSVYDFLEKFPGFDFIIDGEGEIPLQEFLGQWNAPTRSLKDIDAVSGLWYRGKDGKAVRTKPAEVVSDLDELPSPVLANLIPRETQTNLGIMLEGTRACPFRCAFCFEGDKTATTRFASLDRLGAEARYLSERGIHHIHMLDPIICASRSDRLEGLERIFESIYETRRTFVSIEAYADLITPDVARCLRFGSVLDIGLQSINPVTTKTIRRPFKEAKWLRGIELLRENGIKFNVYLISALPYETLNTFLAGVQFTLAARPHRFFCNELCLLNGTMLRSRAEEFGYDFDSTPPYMVHGNRWMPRPVLALVQSLAKVVERGYGQTVGALTEGYERADLINAGRITSINLNEDWKKRIETAPEQVELWCDTNTTDRAMLQSARLCTFQNVQRILLSAPIEILSNQALLRGLVDRGVYHFRTRLDLGRFEKDAQYRETCTTALQLITQKFPVKGVTTIQPVVEVIPVNESRLEQYAAAMNACSGRRGLIWRIDEASELFQSREGLNLVHEFMLGTTSNLSWIQMPEAAMRYYLERLGEQPGEHAINEDIEEIIQRMHALGLLGVNDDAEV